MDVNLSKIIELINTQKYEKAEEELALVYKKYSENFEINKLSGMVVLAQKKYKPALRFFEKCIAINGNDYDVNVNLSYLFTKTQFYSLAIKYAEAAIQIDGHKPHAYQNLADCYFHLGNYELAEMSVVKSIENRGGMESKNFMDTKDLVALYANILLAREKNQDFIFFAKKVLSRAYSSAILVRLLRLDRDLIEPNHLLITEEAIKRFETISNRVDRNTNLSNAYFFLAEYYNKTNQTKSENYYIKANQLISEMQRESLFNRQKYASKIMELFANHHFDYIKKEIQPNKGEGIIFIFGMPRSGTTLTESILSTAHDIQAGGEKVFFSLQLNQSIKNYPDSIDSLDVSFFKSLGDDYLQNIELHRNGKKFFIDKLPENYLFYKFMKLSLPGAKFIHCFRDPWDNAISLFKQNYSINIFYASSFFGIATEYANYKALMGLWKKLDGEDAFLDIDYEKMVNQKSAYIEKIWQYCKLEGQYTDEKRKKHVGITASMQQVTQDIYKTSIKKPDFQEFKEKFLDDLNSQELFWKTKRDVAKM